MKAVVFKGVGNPLAIEDVAPPVVGHGEMILQTKFCGVCGTDLHFTEPGSPVIPGAIMGHEFCGEIAEVGPGVEDGWKVGDKGVGMPFIGCGTCKVCLAGQPVLCGRNRSHASGRIQGGFAEYTPILASNSVRVPAHVSWEEAALTEPLAVGLHAVRRARLDVGANVLVVGAGPVGMAVVMWAKVMGARTIAVTARSTRGAEMAIQLGATAFIEGDKDIRREFRKLAGDAPDVVFEAVGMPNILQQCIGYPRVHGKVVIVGGCGKPDTIVPVHAMRRELEIVCSQGYDLYDFQVTVDRLARGGFDPTPMITDKVSFEEFPDALEALRNRTYQCKTLLSTTA